MKKLGCLTVATAALVLLAALPAHAQKSGGFGFSGGGVRGGGGGVRGGGGGSAGFSGVPAQSSAGFAFRGRSGGFHGGHGHHHNGAVFVGVGVAAPFWWGWPYYYPYYYPPYPYYPYPYYPEMQQSTVYVQDQQQAEPYYWYYCEGAQAYYPYVQQCPNGWMKVVPTPTNGPKASGPKPN
jgi:hypothetical protein